MSSRRMISRFVSGAVGVFVLLAAHPVAADECRTACSAVKMTAIRAGRTALRSCKLGCRGATNVRECRAICVGALRQARDAARAALGQCRRACAPANACEEQCLDPVRECLAPIRGQARSCWADCKSAGREAARSCRDRSDRLACLREVAGQVRACAQGCATSVHDGAETCKSSFDACREGCVPSDPCAEQCAGPLRECGAAVAEQASACGGSCVATAREEAEACMTGPDPAACLAQVAQQLARCANGCRGAAEDQARECRVTFESCVRDCLPPDPCRDVCAASLRGCVAPIAGETETCLSGCSDDALQAGAACLTQPNPRACLLGVAQQFTICARGCEDTARQRAGACWATFRSCGQDCAGTGG